MSLLVYRCLKEPGEGLWGRKSGFLFRRTTDKEGKNKRNKEKNGKIYARITYTDAAGKQREILKRAGTKTEAVEIPRQLEHQFKTQGSEAFEHHGTLDGYLDKWLIFERTLEDARGYLRIHVRPLLGRKPSNIRPLDVQQMIDTMKQKGLSPRTVKHAHSILGRALNQAVK